MKRSRACEDLFALETQKRNKTVADRDAWAATMLLAHSTPAEEELSRLLEAHAAAQQQLYSMDDTLDEIAHCLQLRSHHRSDTRAVSLREREAREAQHALAFKRSPKLLEPTTDDELFPNSPDTIDHIFPDCYYAPRQRRRSAETVSSVYDMSSFRKVLEHATV
jgi:hypothetical protein